MNGEEQASSYIAASVFDHSIVLIPYAISRIEVHTGNHPDATKCIVPRVYLYVKLPFAAGVVHVPNLSEHLALFPSHVVDTHDRPRAPGETVGIPPVQLVLVVEKDASVLTGGAGGVGAPEGRSLDNEILSSIVVMSSTTKRS